MYLIYYVSLAGIREVIDYCNELFFDSEVLSLQSVKCFVVPPLVTCNSLRNVYFV
jgi:hypothetical protein